MRPAPATAADAVDALLPVAVLVLVGLARALRRRLVQPRTSRPSGPPSGPRVETPAPAEPSRPATAAVRPSPRRIAAAPQSEGPSAADVDPAPRRRPARRLDVRRDLIAAELLAPPVALRSGGAVDAGGAAWR